MIALEDFPAMERPAPTADLNQAERDIETTGVCLVTGVLQPSVLARARDALYHAAEEDRRRGQVVRFAADYPEDETNQRVWNLLSRDPVFADLAEHEAALRFVRKYLGWPCLLSNMSANITGPGGGEMRMHTDQTIIPVPWPVDVQVMNVIWCVDDFTEENGATQVFLGSHRLHRPPQPGEPAAPTVPLEAKAGTMIVLEGRVWHHTGFNRTKDQRRGGILSVYVRPIYRTQENWFLSLNPSVHQFASETLLQLLGYRTTHNSGRVNGLAPQ